MTDEQPVDGGELQAFDLALRQQQPIKGIARLRLGVGGGDDVWDIDRQDGQPGLKRQSRLQFAKSCLDGNFPEAGDTDEALATPSESNCSTRGKRSVSFFCAIAISDAAQGRTPAARCA